MSNIVHRSIRKTALPRTGRTLDAVPSSTGSGSGSGAAGSSGSGVKDHSQLTGVISTIDEYKDSAKDIHLTATDADALKRLSTLEIIESTDTETIPGETNVYSALLSKKEDSKRLRKDVADTASKLITFMEGLVSRMKAVLESGADFGVDGSGGHIEATGEAEFLNLFLREYLKTDKIQSQDFHAGALGTGFLIKRDPVTGKSYAEVDELFVRIKAFFTELEIKKLSYAGGNWIFSAAGMKCVRVEDKGTFYRCYFTASDGETSVKNEFRVDDQCRSQEFNIKVGTSQNVSNRYYWRLCVAVGDDYIDLSKADCDTNSDAPLAGDSIVQLGNRTDVARQNAILISAYGEGSPSITQHTGIKSYSLLGTEKTRISPELNEFTGEFYFTTGEKIKDEVDKAKADAAAADSKAVAAQGTATAAKNRLDSWASDGVISPTEKVTLKTEQTNVRAEKLEIVADAVKYNVSATAYVNAYTAYDSDLTYYTYVTPENITILPTFATRQSAYYSARTAILAAIATAAKSYVDTGIGSAKSYTDTTFAAVDGKITLAVDSVKVGGRNLIINSKEITQPATSSNWNFAAHEITQIKPDTIYILSVDKSVINSGPDASAFSVLIYDVTTNTDIASVAVPISIDRQIVKMKTIPSLNVNNNIKLLVYTGPTGAASNRGMSFYNVKLEEGNKATAWSPAPEDQTNYADQVANTVRTETNTKLEVIDGKISQTVTKTEYEKVGKLAVLGTNYSMTPQHSGYAQLNDYKIVSGTSGFTLYRIHKVNISLERIGLYPYSDPSGLAAGINSITSDYILVLVSYDAIKADAEALAAIVDYGGSGNLAISGSYERISYVLIGEKGIGRGNGLEQYKRDTAGDVIISTTIINGSVSGFFGGGNMSEIISRQGSSITQLSDKIELKVSKTEYNNQVYNNNNLLPQNAEFWERGSANEGSPVGSTLSQILTQTGITARIRLKELIYIGSNTDLSISANTGAIQFFIFQFDTNKLYLGKYIGWVSTDTFTLENSCRYIYVVARNSTDANINPGVDGVNARLDITNKITNDKISNSDLLSLAYSGVMKYTDPTFKEGYNGIGVYNNLVNGNVSVIRTRNVTNLPTDSEYCLMIVTNGIASPGSGGFNWGLQGQHNTAYIFKLIAYIPDSEEIGFANNALGIGSVCKWLTDNKGVDNWKEYAFYCKYGHTGNISTTGFFYLKSGKTSQTWFLAYATVYQVGANENYPTVTQYETKITQLEDSISFKATKESVDNLKSRVEQAEIKLQPDNIWLGISDKTVAVTRKTVDLTGLNQSWYYPVTIWIGNMVSDRITIQVSRTLDGNAGIPGWSTHGSGFSLSCKWTTNGGGWGTLPVVQRILEYTHAWCQTDVIPAGSIGQMSNSSTEYIYLRGGSKYDILVESKNAVGVNNINLRTSSFSVSSETIDLKTSVTRPLVQVDQKIEADDLLPTGIDIKNNQITVTAPTFRVQDNAGTPVAVFTTNAAGKPVLKAENIDVENLSVKKITGAKGTFNEIKSDDDRMKLWGGGINFRDSRDGITAAFGNEAVSAASGLSTSMYIERNGYAYAGVNISAILSAKGMWCYDTLGLYGNVALSIPYGKIAGLRVYVRRITKSVTYGTSGIMDNWLIVTASGVTITLPSMTDEMDGHIIVISNRSNGNVTINGPGYDGNSRILGINRHMLGIFTRTEYKWDYSLLD